MKELILKAIDEYPLALNIYEVENPKAIIQVLHGMEEHKERYQEIAEKLNESGYTVVVPDMRGHGKNAIDLGHFANKDGYKLLLSDVKTIRNYISETYPGKDVYLFGHSMGTLTARAYLMANSNEYKKVCLSGYPCYTAGAKAGLVMYRLFRMCHNAKYKSPFFEKIGVESFNNAIKNPRTKCDWLSYNTENVDKYIEDPFCGHGFTISAFRDLFKIMVMAHNPKKFTDVNKELPFYLLHGQDDPCVGGVKGSNDSIRVLKEAGFADITEKSYPEMRHEILQEADKLTVMNDIVEFFNK